MKQIITWFLVANGTEARLFRSTGPGQGVEPVSGEIMRGPNLPDREIMSDRPGRTFDSAGQGRHAMEPRTDPALVEKRRFTHGLAETLNAALEREEFDRLVLAAPPKILGQLREDLSKSVRAKVEAELSKDLTHLPVTDIEARLSAVIAP
jgi:protein required for attachment to host cells